MQMPRTAVLFFGQIRANETHWKHVYETIVKPNDADVFIYSTYYKGFDTLALDFEEAYRAKVVTQNCQPKPTDALFDIFSPKLATFNCLTKYDISMVSKKYSDYPEFEKKHLPSYNGRRNHTNSVSKVVGLKQEYERENGFIYDHVILTRLDVYLESPLLVSNLPKHDCILGQMFSPLYILDMLIVGPSKHIDIFSNLHNDIITYFDKYIHNEPEYNMDTMERYYALHMRKYNVPYDHYNIPFRNIGRGLWINTV